MTRWSYIAALAATFAVSLVMWFQANGVKSVTGLLGVSIVLWIGYIIFSKQPTILSDDEIKKLKVEMQTLNADNQRLLENYLELRDQISVLKLATGVRPGNKAQS
jgi:hypothetical protein